MFVFTGTQNKCPLLFKATIPSALKLQVSAPATDGSGWKWPILQLEKSGSLKCSLFFI